MPDTIEKTIYKLELDDSAYIKGVDALATSTKKLTAEQERANNALKTNEAALKANGEFLQKAKKDLDDYTGTNERYRKQLEKSFTGAQADQVKLTKLVADNKAAYDAATKSAQEFANISARATQLQQQTTGGKIPVAAPLGIPSPITNVSGLQSAIPQTRIEFEQLSIAIAAAEQHMQELDATSEEFKLLAPIVDQGKIALQQYDAAAQGAATKTQSIRGQLRAAKEELVKLEQAGKGATAQYFELEKRTAKLTDQFNDQQQRIKILASDTKLLDFGKGAITAATSAFQTYAAVSILAGDESAELQKKTMQLFAAMQLLQSLEHLSNLTRREGILAVHLQSASQAVYTTVVGASTGALKAYRLALLGATGIGAVIAIGLLVSKFIEFANAAKEAAKNQKLLKEINDQAIKGYVAEVTKLEIIRTKLNDVNIPQAERIKLAKEYNKTADEGNKIDIKQIENISLVNAAIDSQIQKIKQRGLARAAENIITQRSETLQLAQEAARLKNLEFSIQATLPIEGTTADPVFQKTAQLKFLTERINKDPDVIAAQEELNRALQVGLGLITTDGLTTDTKAVTEKKEIENVFIRTLRELLTRLRAASKTEFQSIDLIQQEFANKLFDEIDKIDELVAKKQLTAKQGNLLTKILEKIIGKESGKAVADFKKKVSDAIDKLTTELADQQSKVNEDSLNLLQDEFNKRAKLIEFNEAKELADAKQATENRLDSLDLQRLLIGEQAYQDAKAIIISTGEQNALNIVARFGQDRQNLAADIFKKTLDAFQEGLNQGLVGRDEELAKQIRASSDKFLAGKITFEQFQKDITQIQRDEEGIRRDITLANQRSELATLDRHIASVIDKTSKEYQDLIKLRDNLASSIAQNEKEDAIKDAEVDPNKRKNDTLLDYVSNIGQLVDSVISFWQKANEAESAALDRSISLQEKRVDAAQRIATKGNAQYLRQEEDRLKELQVQKENAARRELAINAALQASQLLVGITGAIAKIATPGIGIAETIGAISVIFAALATGYGLVKSLQGSQPKLAKGTKRVTRDGHPAGTDTIPAWLNENEAVIPAEKNKAYHPTVAAIYDGTVPAEHLNNFVKTYHRVKPVPQPNYERIKDAAELGIGQDGRMAVLLHEQNRKIDENNDLQRQTLRAMKSMAVSAVIDKDGVAIMVNEYISQMTIDKKT